MLTRLSIPPFLPNIVASEKQKFGGMLMLNRSDFVTSDY